MKIPHFKLPKFYGFHIPMKGILQNIFGLLSIYAIAIFPFVFYRNRYAKSNILVRTEKSIHIQQQMECGLAGALVYVVVSSLSGLWLVTLPVLFLYCLLYLFFFLINLFKYKKFLTAWVKVPMEQEAHLNSNINTYLGLRKPFSWIKYCSDVL